MIEYKKVVVPTAISEEQLNVLGKEGWDNYAISGNAYFFKRAKQEEVKKVNDKKQGR